MRGASVTHFYTKKEGNQSMSKPLLGMKVVILVANGFDEADMTATQRALMAAGANARIVSPELGLVNSWNGESWGHHFAIDTGLNAALGADYAMLVIPGGTRSIDKLKLTAHTKRFIGSFMAAQKPVAVWGGAMPIMTFIEADEEAANIVTAECTDEDSRKAFAAEMVAFFGAAPVMKQAA
jgi:hypothetical protein